MAQTLGATKRSRHASNYSFDQQLRSWRYSKYRAALALTTNRVAGAAAGATAPLDHRNDKYLFVTSRIVAKIALSFYGFQRPTAAR